AQTNGCPQTTRSSKFHAAAIVGSITLFASVIFVAGKPPVSACLRIIASSLAASPPLIPSASLRAFTPVFDGLWTRVNALMLGIQAIRSPPSRRRRRGIASSMVYACAPTQRTVRPDEGGPYVSATPQGRASRHQAREHAGAGLALSRRPQHAVGADQIRGDPNQGAL